jgi:hypothetical protein
MRTFLKAAGFLKLNSYWFKGFRKQQVQAQKNVQVLPPVLICFFCRFRHEISSCYRKLINMGTSRFQHFFWDALSEKLAGISKLCHGSDCKKYL